MNVMCAKLVRPNAGLTQLHLEYDVVLFLSPPDLFFWNFCEKKYKVLENSQLTKIIVSWGQESFFLSFSPTSPHQGSSPWKISKSRGSWTTFNAPLHREFLGLDPVRSISKFSDHFGGTNLQCFFLSSKGLWSYRPPFYLLNNMKSLRTYFSFIFRKKPTGMQKTPLPLKNKWYPRYQDN